MNIFKTYVKRNLKNNRLRTTMTIIGIILSVALVAAVIEGAFSGVEYVRNILKSTTGNHHGYAVNMTMETAYELISKDEVEGYAGFNTLGWAEIGSQNSTKPYLLIKEASEDIRDFMPVKIVEGHFPENENEILIPAHLATNGNVILNVGDTITLNISERYYDPSLKTESGYFLEYDSKIPIQNGIIPETAGLQNGERLLTEDDGFEVLTKTYTVCGIMERLPYTIEEYMCPGYTAIVKDSAFTARTFEGSEIPSYNVFFRLKDAGIYNTFHNDFEKSHPGMGILKNRELVAMYGGVNTRSVTFFLTGFVTVLIFLILFGSISLVYNSFSISINERTKQIGILKSIGATKKQIRKTVFYEAFYDCIISVPLGILLGCLGIGVTLFLLQEGFTAFIGYFSGYSADDVKIKLVINVPLIILAVIIVIVAVVLSAAIPALRASSFSPIDLVRQNPDIRDSKKLRKSRILTHFFGAEGMLASKNYSRNKKRYRSTVVSLSVSIILFIAASSFCSYLNSATDTELYTGTMDLIYYNYENEPYMANMALGEAKSAADETVDEPDENTENQKKDFREVKEMLLSAKDVTNVIASKNLYDYWIYAPDEETLAGGYKQNTVVQEIDVDPETDPDEVSKVYQSQAVDEEAEESFEFTEPMYENSGSVYFIDDESFYDLVKSEGITLPESSKGVLNAVVYNKGTVYTFDEDGNRKKSTYTFIEEDRIPKKLKLEWCNDYADPTVAPVDQMADKDGEVYVVYVPEELQMNFYDMMSSERRYYIVEEAVFEAFKKYLESMGKDTKDLDLGDKYVYETELDEDSVENGTPKEEVLPLNEEELALIDKCTFVNRKDLTYTYDLNIIGVTYNEDYALSDDATILLPFSAMPDEIVQTMMSPEYYIYSNNSSSSEEAINKLLLDNKMDTGGLYNVDSANVGRRMIGKIVNVFSYGFILLISLVAIANVFNTISTNVHLRRREFGMLKSMGLSNKGVTKILNIECLIYGAKSLIIGLPLSIPITFVLYKITNRAFSVTFGIPWYSVVIAVVAVFIVVFITMLYASGKIKRDNTIDALRAENI